MAIKYLKKSPKTSSTDDTKTTEIVKGLLKDIETNKEQACIDLTKKFDKYDGDIIVSKERIEKIKKVMNKVRWTSKSPLSSEVPLEIEWCNGYNYDMD